MIPADQQQRQQALDITRSCCVQAPAGSGKTELLTQRLMKLLAQAQRPEEILAITFTRKAASEMRNRLLQNLDRAAGLDDETLAVLDPHERQTMALARDVLARDQQNNWSLLANTSRLRITTIDSFNQFLVNQLPVTSSLGLLPDITVKPRELFRRAVRDTLDELKSDSRLGKSLAVLLAHFNNRWQTLEDQLCQLLGNRDQWLTYILSLRQHGDKFRAPMEDTLTGIVETTLAELARAFQPYQAELSPLLAYAAGNLDDTVLVAGELDGSLPATGADNLAAWQALMDLLLTAKCEFRKKLVAAQGFPAQSAPGSKEDKASRKIMKDAMEALLVRMAQDTSLLAAIETFSFIPDSQFQDAQWRVLDSLTVVLPELVSRLSLVFARQRQTDHTLISAAALEALGDDEHPTDLAMRLDYSLKHILVDEFQDTSTLQIQLLKKLTSGWQPDDGRTLFIVGDGMQSCYGFRNARVGLFLAARDNGIGDITFDDLRLTSNFRSEEAVVNWVNSVFQDAFPQHDDISRGGVSFNKAVAIHPSSGLGGVKTLLVCADKDADTDKTLHRRREAETVATQIERLQQQCPGDSIAVLVRSRSHLSELIPVLRERGLQWQASEIDPLLSYPFISDLLTLTRALLSPGDNTFWLALMRTPLLGLGMADIHRLSRHAADKELSLWQAMTQHATISDLTAEAAAILDRVVPLLGCARDERQRLPLRDWIENLWLMLGGTSCLTNPQLADNTRQFFALLEEHDKGGDITDIHVFEAELNALYGGGQHPDAGLQIMTIHKAKGLEFDHVIIPGLDRGTGSKDRPLLLWKEHITADGEDRLVISLPSQKGKDRDKDRVYHYLQCETELEQRLESTRLLYIGVTRAIRQAILVACIERQEDTLMAPNKQSLLARIWPQLEPRLDSDDCELIMVDHDSEAHAAQQAPAAQLLSRRLPPAWRNPLFSPPASMADEAREDEDEPPHHNLLEKKSGDIIHACLQQVAMGQLALDDTGALARLAPYWRNQLAPLTDSPDTAIAAIHHQLQACRQHDRYAWLFDDSHRDQGAEVAISDFSLGGRREYVIDRTFLDAAGTRWVIDYKSSRPAPGEDLAAFANRQAERYRGQLANYARLYRAMDTAPVRCALFFTAIPLFHEITLDPGREGEQSALF